MRIAFGSMEEWYCEAMATDQFNSSVVVADDKIYAVEGRRGGPGSIAIKTGGKGDITKTDVVWNGQDSNRFSTPLLYEGRMYLISGSIAKCVNATNDEQIFQARMQDGEAAPANDAPGGPPGAGPGPQGGQPPGGQPPREQGGGRGGFGGFGGGGRGGSDYSSPVLGDGKIYYVTRGGDIHVIKPTDTFEKLATNRLTAESEDFSASPAISSGQIFFRSNKHLYCVSLHK